MEIDRCEDLRPHLPTFVTDSLDATVQARIREHLAMGCAHCATEIARLDAAFYSIPASLEPVAFLDGGAEAMAAAITRSPQDVVEVPILFPEGKPLRIAWTVAFFLAAALVVGAVWGRGVQRELREAELIAGTEIRKTRQVVDEYRSLEEAHAGARALLDSVMHQQTDVLDLTGSAGFARAFVSKEAKTLLLTLPALPPGTNYEVVLDRGDYSHTLGPIEPRIAESGGGRQYPWPNATDGRLQVRDIDGRVVLSQ